MDYSKYGIEKKQKKMDSYMRKAEKKFNFTIFRVLIIAFIFFVVIGVSAGIGSVKAIMDSAPEINTDDVAPKAYKSYIYNNDGTLLNEIVGNESNRIYVTIDEIPEMLQNAFIALEDERFKEHNGVDPKGIVRAFVVGVKGGQFSEGASTITQQLLKLQIFDGGEEESFILRLKRKFQEQYLAVKLEEQLTKDEILEAYLNTINLGQGNYGVEAAANYYFGKTCGQLDISECAVLAAIAQSPTLNNPVLYPDNNAERKDIALRYMYNQGYITQDEYEEAKADLVYERIEVNANIASAKPNTYSWYVDAAIAQILKDLQEELGYSYDEALNKLYSGGLSIYLAQDQRIQNIVDNYYREGENTYFPSTEYLISDCRISILNDDGTQTHYQINDLKAYLGRSNLLYSSEEACEEVVQQYKAEIGATPENITSESIQFTIQIQSSFVVIDQETGWVLALVGGRGSKNSSLSFNRATEATRQPGSTFKIVSTYLPAIEEKGYQLSTIVKDEVYKAVDGTPINNVDKLTEGNITLRKAIIVSKNTVAAKILTDVVTPELAYTYLTEKLGFTTLDPVNDLVTSMALGGLYNGVTNLEMTAAYAAIANNGVYNKPVLYSKILDRDGSVLIDNSVPESTPAMSTGTSYILTTAMEDVLKSGTGMAARMSNMASAGKTGTTDDQKDLWFVGYTPYYTAGVWYGYDDNTPIRDRVNQSQIYEQQKLWKAIMEEIHSDYGRTEFTRPDDIIELTICTKSGKRAGTSCPRETNATEYFTANSAPTEYCTDHTVRTICSECNGLATSETPESYKKTVTFDSNSKIPTKNCTHKKNDDKKKDKDDDKDPDTTENTTPSSESNTPSSNDED